LMHSNIDDIKRVSDERIAQAIDLMRQGKVVVEPGYDGVFGKIGIFSVKKESVIMPQHDSDGQMRLF
ncbi:MAG: hypothetical protein ABIK31_02575, partial [candidate division WOR-3 bacterium]